MLLLPLFTLSDDIEQAVRKKNDHLQAQVRTHRTPTKTSYMMNILALYMSMIKLHIYMYDKIAYKS